MYTARASSLACFLLNLAAVAGFAAPLAPPPPETYDVRLRYQINAFRNERVTQYFEMIKSLKAMGFQMKDGAESDPDNPDANELTGTIASKNARQLLSERHVRSVLLVPAGAKLPAENEFVHVQMELAPGLSVERERMLADATRVVLKALGFREATGYDNRGHTRLVGMIPVKSLPASIDDLRKNPAGQNLAAPFATQWPLIFTEVQPSVSAWREPAAPAIPKGQEDLSITPDLRAVLANPAEASKPRHLELLLAVTPTEDNVEWRRLLKQAAPGLRVEGRVGPLVAVLARPDQAAELAKLSLVSTVRLPRSARPQANVAASIAGLEKTLREGYRDRAVRLAIVDSDFRGWQEAVKSKQLPASTKLLDLTAERSPDLVPEPAPADAPGVGTRTALAAAAAAPRAELTLIRIDPAAPDQVLLVARAINGDRVQSESLLNRGEELDTARVILNTRHEELNQERATVLGDFAHFEAQADKYADLLKDKKAMAERRQEYFRKRDQLNKDEQAHQARVSRYLKLYNDINALRGTQVVASDLVWDEGQPVDGGSALSRYFDDRPFHAALWLQSAGDTRGQNWAGLLHDADSNGVLEFGPTPVKDRRDRWTNELNFLGWKPSDGTTSLDLPAKTRLRISVQWREAHDPEFLHNGEDLYRRPLAQFRLVVLRQRDPSGQKMAADEFDVIARSSGVPERLENQVSSGVYEQTVEFTADEAGRYAVRVEAIAPAGIRPPGVPALPFMQATGEVRPRVFVQTLAGNGRALFLDYATEESQLGVPADARRVVPIPAAK
jgi:hypothetical protein